VAIPEGLPVAVSLAMALSTDKLKSESILIKELDAIQKCAMVHDVCVGKTGCLTKGDMKIKMYQLTNNENIHQTSYDDDESHFISKLDVQTELKDLIVDAMICNNDATMEAEDEEHEKEKFEKNFGDDEDALRYKAIGGAIEVGVIDFLLANNIDVNQRLIDRNVRQKKLV
jgi:magnesium-transporting ATPase (P-type)